MNDPGSLSSVFRVESLEWSEHAGGATLRVRGRWRRRRPAGGGQPQLVVARGDRRQRFPATPEPPGLGGAEPGTWQMSFGVPGAWVPLPGDRTWLQIGAVMIPLPVADEPEPTEVTAAVPVAPDVLAERRLQAAELALETAHDRAAAAERRYAELEAERERLKGELEAARLALAKRDRARRLAEQREHAERAERLELQRELVALSGGREPAGGAAAEAMADRIGELEAEREALERRLLEAEQLRAAAQAGRRRAEAGVARGVESRAVMASVAVLAAEAELARAPVGTGPVPPADVGVSPAGVAALVRERRMVSGRAAGRGRAAPDSGRLREVLDAIGAELMVLRGALSREQQVRVAADGRADALAAELELSRRRAADAHAALGALRAELSTGSLGRAPVREAAVALPAPGPAPVPGSGAAPPVDPGRLDAARTRLRTSATEPVPPSGVAWIERALRSLCAVDPAAAGRLVLALLPVHALREDPAVRYDLVLADAGVVRVDVPGGGRAVTVAAGEAPRAASEVDFAFHGDLAALGRFVVAGGSRRWRRDRGRVAGERSAAGTLARIAAARLRWRALLAGGVTLDGWLGLTLAARAIDPAQTRGERFAIAFSDPAAGPALLLLVSGGRPPVVLQAPFSAPAGVTEIRVAGAELAPLLAGMPGVGMELHGESRTLELIQAWIELAQSG